MAGWSTDWRDYQGGHSNGWRHGARWIFGQLSDAFCTVTLSVTLSVFVLKWSLVQPMNSVKTLWQPLASVSNCGTEFHAERSFMKRFSVRSLCALHFEFVYSPSSLAGLRHGWEAGFGHGWKSWICWPPTWLMQSVWTFLQGAAGAMFFCCGHTAGSMPYHSFYRLWQYI